MLTLRRTIQADLFRYEGKTGLLAFVKTLLLSPGFRYSVALRVCNRLYRSSSVLGRLAYFPARMILLLYSMSCGFQIPAETEIGSGFYINHKGWIVVNPGVVMGCNINLHPGVTIGQTNRGKKKGCPHIGNSVWIGTNSVIVGGIKIGNNVLIAPGSYVTSDVPDGAVVAGNPSCVVSFGGVEGYIDNAVET
jgi:serine O-acetyltransferase